MRAPKAILSIAALFWGFLQAPSFHIHAGALDHAAAPIPVHVHRHFVPHAPGLAIIAQTADDDAVETEWSVTRSQPVTADADITFPGNTPISPLVVASAVRHVPGERAHDPPDLAAKQPRSPPA